MDLAAASDGMDEKRMWNGLRIYGVGGKEVTWRSRKRFVSNAFVGVRVECTFWPAQEFDMSQGELVVNQGELKYRICREIKMRNIV